jgi:hypothetical protein
MFGLDLSLEKCWAIAKQSKSDIRFGAFIEKAGRIIGYGYNHHPTPKERRNAIKIFGKKLDYCIHAEETALIEAIIKNKNLNGSRLYVAGFDKNGKPFRKEKTFFTCKRCAERVLLPFNLIVVVPTKKGWKELTPLKAYKTALQFKNTNFWNKQLDRRK